MDTIEKDTLSMRYFIDGKSRDEVSIPYTPKPQTVEESLESTTPPLDLNSGTGRLKS